MIRHLCFVLLILLLCVSCRTVTTTRHELVHDTITLQYHDTTRLFTHHDTTFVTRHEVITEHVVFRYDTVGRIIQQDIDRIIRRRSDSLAAIRLDSLLSATHLTASSSHADEVLTVRQAHPPAAPWYQQASSLFLFIIVIVAIMFSIRIYCHSTR